MGSQREQVGENGGGWWKEESPKLSSPEDSSPHSRGNPHSQFEKNYPKNVFIPMIEHLNERGLRQRYEECVGTRESFEGKNVVSLAEIHRVMSQGWFREGINIAMLLSNMSNKILMNSKIKKKLFHLLLIKELFAIPLHDSREFKKQVSKTANQIADRRLPDHPLFCFPSALIYLLHLFAHGLTRPLGPHSDDDSLDESANKVRETSSKLEYKYYIGKIISGLNNFPGSSTDLHDHLSEIKQAIVDREIQVRQKYDLPQLVPSWGLFTSKVIDRCLLVKRGKQRLTYSLLNSWIQEFKEKTTTVKGFEDIAAVTEEPVVTTGRFEPIILVHPPL